MYSYRSIVTQTINISFFVGVPFSLSQPRGRILWSPILLIELCDMILKRDQANKDVGSP